MEHPGRLLGGLFILPKLSKLFTRSLHRANRPRASNQSSHTSPLERPKDKIPMHLGRTKIILPVLCAAVGVSLAAGPLSMAQPPQPEVVCFASNGGFSRWPLPRQA